MLQRGVVIGDLNTKDWEYQSETGINTAKKLFIDGPDQGYTIVEVHEQKIWTHGELIDYMISVVKSRVSRPLLSLNVLVGHRLRNVIALFASRDPQTRYVSPVLKTTMQIANK